MRVWGRQEEEMRKKKIRGKKEERVKEVVWVSLG
jgi:hypothetical protein